MELDPARYVRLFPLVRKYEKALAKAARLKAIIEPRNDAIVVSLGLRSQHDGRPITRATDLYLALDSGAEKAFALFDEANQREGYDAPEQYCPQLVAEEAEGDAQRKLLDAAEPLTGLSRNIIYSVEKLNRYASLLVGLVRSARHLAAA